MTGLPVLETPRLRLRGFEPFDAADVQRLAGDYEIARTTLRIPHPYPDGRAEAWIAGHADAFAQQREAVFAVTRRAAAAEPPRESAAASDAAARESGGALLGAIGLEICRAHRRAELGYFVGRPYWGRGYATEAGRAVLRFGFEVLGLNKIFAHHFVHNPASGRVLVKLGMRHEGRLRQHVSKWGQYVDLEQYAALREDFPGPRQTAAP